MKELDFLNIIKKHIGSDFIGDDCAYLKDLGIVVSQDSLAEDIHFRLDWCSPYQLGYKAVTVNISDILASGSEPMYITIGLSLPASADENFIDEFYKGAKSALRGAKIIGGDITGSDKVYISITAIGLAKGRKISSRKNAKEGYAVIVSKDAFEAFGKSSAGLKELMNGGNNQSLIKAHLEPVLDEEFSRNISCCIKEDYAMMDTSDGLADALYKIAEASNATIDALEFDGIFGAEDYRLVAVVPEDFLANLKDFVRIGTVLKQEDYVLKIGTKKYYKYDELGLYNHFEEKI